MVSAQTTIFFGQCFWFDCCLPCEKWLVPETTRQLWLWLEPRMPCGMFEVATTPRSWLPWPSAAKARFLRAGGRTIEGTTTPVPKVVLPPTIIFSLSKIQTMACVSFITFTATKHTSAFFPACIRKTNTLPNPYPFGSWINTCHCHSHAFPANAGLIFLTDELTNDRYLVDTGATLSIVPCTSNAGPSGPLFKGADGQPIPLWGFVSKTAQFQGKLYTARFLQAVVAGPILGIDFLRKFRITVATQTSQLLFACTATAPASTKPPLPSVLPLSICLFPFQRCRKSLILSLTTWSVWKKNYLLFYTWVMWCHPQVFSKSRRLDP